MIVLVKHDHIDERVLNQRLAFIVEEVRRSGYAAVGDLAVRASVSAATIRRDLAVLERDGLIRRNHGGAELVGPVLHKVIDDSSFRAEVGRMASEKQRIGVAASSLIEDGDVVAFGPGTTTTATACSILPNKKVTIVTNALNIALELSRRPGVDLFVTGGYLREGWFSLVGQSAVETIRERIFDKVFIGVNGLNPEFGFTDCHDEEANVNRSMLRQAKRRIVVADHSKLGVLAPYRLCEIGEIHTLVTDGGADEEILRPYREKGIEIIRA